MANNTVWAIDASSTNPQIVQVDLVTGATLTQFTAPHSPANQNGRGLAVDTVNQLIYYGYITTGGIASDAHIYLTNFSGTDLGVFINMTTLVPGMASVNALYFDAGTLWVTSGTPFPLLDNHGYQVNIASKTLVNTVSGMGNLRDGMYVNSGKGIVILNRGQGSGPYDLYSLSGSTLTLTTSGFIDPVGAGFGPGIETGITTDGTHYITSFPQGIGGGSTQLLLFWNMATGAFVSSLTLPAPGPQSGVGWLLENMAAVAAPAPPPVSVPNNFRIKLAGVKRWPKM